MIKLRNPWGLHEWNQRWCDGSELWEKHPGLAKVLEYTPAEDGIFWMEFKDFLEVFDNVYVSPKGMIGKRGKHVVKKLKKSKTGTKKRKTTTTAATEEVDHL